VFCPTHSTLIPKNYEHRQQTTEDMSFDLFKYTIDRFNKAVSVTITGVGEALLNKDFFKMLKYAGEEKHMKVSTISNGVIIGDYIEELASSSLSNIQISLNSHTQEYFEEFTGNNREMFNRAYENVGKLVDYRDQVKSKLKICLSFVVDKTNWRLIPEFIKVGEKLKVDKIILQNMLSAPFKGFTMEERTLESKDREVVDFLCSVIPDHKKNKVQLPVLLNSNETRTCCRSYFETLRVDGAGNYSSCARMMLNMEGNGKVTDKEVWNSLFFRQARRKFLKNKIENLPKPCQVCYSNIGISPQDVHGSE
jgi:MoaA/NifB/PqqE/SkfB family radical SAM enzyme